MSNLTDAEIDPRGPPFTVDRYGSFGATVIGERDWLREQCERDAKDAARYRWLRECSIFRSYRSVHIVWSHYDNGVYLCESKPNRDVLDQLIDECLPSSSTCSQLEPDKL